MIVTLKDHSRRDSVGRVYILLEDTIVLVDVGPPRIDA